ncbi:MAG: hypothetical protein RIM33_05480 [Alphaproteobacteria bacterium]
MKRACILGVMLFTLPTFQVPIGYSFAQAPENPFSNAGGNGSGTAIQTETLPEPAEGGGGSAATGTFSNSAPAATSAPPPQPQGGGEVLLQMSRRDCERLIRRADVPGADYVPGVDVRGNAVHGADLEGTLTAADLLPESIAFELSLNPLGYAGNDALEDVFSNSSTGFGMVEYNLASGALTLDGRRLDDGTESEMLDLCRNALGR